MHLANWTKNKKRIGKRGVREKFSICLNYLVGGWPFWCVVDFYKCVYVCVCVMGDGSNRMFLFRGIFFLWFSKNKSEQLRQGGHQLMSGGSSNRKTKNRSINWNMIKCLCVLCACVVVIMCLMFKFQWNKFPKTKKKDHSKLSFVELCCCVVRNKSERNKRQTITTTPNCKITTTYLILYDKKCYQSPWLFY